MKKIYCSFVNNILTGWSTDENSFSTTETIREIEMNEDEYEQLEKIYIGFFCFDEISNKVVYSQNLVDEFRLLKMETLAVDEENKAEELKVSLTRLGLYEEDH